MSTDFQKIIMASSWKELARAQYDVPGTADFVSQLSDKIGQDFRHFGPRVYRRVYSSIEFGVTTFPPAQRRLYAWGQGYLIAWVFALDHLLDTSPSYETATDLQLLLDHLIATPPTVPLRYTHLPLSADAASVVPGVGYSILDVVNAIQPLRCHLYQTASNVAGPQQFDRYLAKVVKMMVRESAWRLRELPEPDFATYIETATITICGGLCVATLNATLPNAEANWARVEQAAHTMCLAVRLINDLATQPKDDAEGTPNAVTLLRGTSGGQAPAAITVRGMVDRAVAQLQRLCTPLLRLPQTDPLYILGFYIYYSWVMTEAMYSGGDFLAASAPKAAVAGGITNERE